MKLLNASSSYLHDMLIVAWNTGMRPGEIKKLKWEYIDNKAGFIRLPKEATKEKKDKNIPINHHVRGVLNSQPRALHHDFVFTFRGNPIRSRGGVKRSFMTACKNAKIPYGQKTANGITLHDFRRTVKTNMVNAGVDKVYRDLILGHSLHGMDVHYMAPSDDDLKNAIEKYTTWVDDQIANVDHFVDQSANQ